MAEQTQQPPQQIVIHNQYVKDFSFENPNAPASLARSDKPPQIEISVNVNADPLPEERTFEVVLTFRATAMRDDEKVFLAELTYGAVLVVAESVEEKLVHPLVMIEGPRLVFPFARMMLSEMTQAGGYMPLNVQPIDFVGLYQASMQKRAENAAEKSVEDASGKNGDASGKNGGGDADDGGKKAAGKGGGKKKK